MFGNFDNFFLDPHTLKPWKFPNSSVEHEGVIVTTPEVLYRMDKNRNPQWIREGVRRWCLWVSVKTDDDYHGFCIDKNVLARAFNGRSNEENLRRWADQWKVGGRLQISWTEDVRGERTYHGRYTPPVEG
jgi:hypothetical protein